MDTQIHEAKKISNMMYPNNSMPRHIIIKDNFEIRKRETTHHIQGHPHKTIRFLSRNLESQKGYG